MALGMQQRSYSLTDMDCEPKSFVRSNGAKSICSMVACTLIELKAGSRVYIHYMALSYEPYAHYRAKARITDPDAKIGA